MKNGISNAGDSSQKTPRIAIIGCGAIAELFYLPAFSPKQAENLILVDRNEVRAKALAEQFGVKDCVADYHDALSMNLDGAIVALPSHLHFSVTMELLQGGLNVLCEKPLAETATEGKKLVQQAEQSGAALAVNYTRRLSASYIKVKEIVQSRQLGAPLAMSYYEGEEFRWPTASGFYFDTKISTRGVLLDRGAHVLDLICWWLGAKPHVTSSQNDSFGGREAVAEIHFAHDRCIGEVKLSLLGKFPCIYRVECEDGTVEGDIYDFHNVELVSKSGQRKVLKLDSREKLYDDFGRTLVSNFVDVVSEGQKPLVSGKDILDSMECIDECYETARRFDMPWYETIAVDHVV